MISNAEVVSPQLKSNPTKFLDHTATEYEKLKLFQYRVNSSSVKVDDHELQSLSLKFEEAVHREKARVDSNLLNLTSIFTRMVHETRNKVFKHLDDQLLVFRDNVAFLRERIHGFNQQLPNVPAFDKTEFGNRVNQTPDAKRSDLIEDKLNEIYKVKRACEANSREKAQYTSFIEKIKAAPQVLQKRNDESYAELNRRFETVLKNIVDEYQPKGLKAFRQKRTPTSHLEVDYHNYFKSSVLPTIHYFEPETKNLHLYTLPTTTHGQKQKSSSKKVELDTEFVIPAYHGSIITPEGKLFIMGGTDVSKGYASNSRCYEYDEKTRSLYRKANMGTERYGFGITYSKGKVYVFGGLNSSGVLASCEAYEIATNKWSALPSMSSGSAHSNVANFKDRYIYKFGGFKDNQSQNRSIERYSILDRIWSSVNVQYDLVFPLCASAQINTHEVIVFGGIQENKTGSKRSWVLSVDSEPSTTATGKSIYEAVTSLGHADLPFGDGFWDPQAIVHDNNLYVLQNVSDQGGVSGRRLLEYRNGAWNILN